MNKKKIIENIIKGLTLIMFLPVLFCVLFIGKNMEYYEVMKPTLVWSTGVISVLAISGVIFLVVFSLFFEKNELGRKGNTAVNIFLLTFFVGIYFLNCRFTREIAFYLPWDIMVVQKCAAAFARNEPMGYIPYFSMYPNNIPITYFLGRLYRIAQENPDFAQIPEYIYMQANCLFLSTAGFFSCLSVKKLTKKLLPTLTVLFFYTVLVSASGWKIAPYTDTFGIIFPVLSVYFYICAMNQKDKIAVKRCLLVLSALLISVLGGFVKPNLYIVTIALMAMETFHFLHQWKTYWKILLIDLCFVVLLFAGTKILFQDIIKELQFDYNPVVSFVYNHYLMMGLNEETTGGYTTDDVGMIGSYQFDKKERIRAEREIIYERLRERGAIGTLYFYLKKLTMTFNEATFGWNCEVWVHDYYPDSLSSNTGLTRFLRQIYWDGNYMGAYYTICQIVWIFAILGIPGIVLYKRDDETALFLCICFLGIIFYQMLFEARARYLFAFLPFLLSIAACGLQEYGNMVKLIADHVKKRYKRT